jgi:hypothetical protein
MTTARMEYIKPRCNNCPYFYAQKDTHGPQQGQCRRSTPQMHNNSTTWGTWPVVKEDWWCGKHPDFENPKARVVDENS